MCVGYMTSYMFVHHDMISETECAQAADRRDGGARDAETDIINDTIRKTSSGKLRVVSEDNPWYQELVTRTKSAYFRDEKGGVFSAYM